MINIYLVWTLGASVAQWSDQAPSGSPLRSCVSTESGGFSLGTPVSSHRNITRGEINLTDVHRAGSVQT